ncbi:hypothetical protein CsSME_00007096 [Camellia sinensis var. sinensis]
MLDGTPQNKLDMFMASNSSPLTSLFNEAANEMAIESENSSGFVPYHHLPMILPENGPKRRAETWVFEEIQCLIHLRREVNCQFNTAKSQKHLWDQIYVGMRENGWERTPQNCNDKWRNLLKEYKNSNGGIGSSRQVCFDELEEYCREKKSNGISKKLRDGSSSFMCFFVEYFALIDVSNGFNAFLVLTKPVFCLDPVKLVKHFGRFSDNSLERTYHDADPLDIHELEGIVPNEFPSWNWRGTPRRDEDVSGSGGRVISVKYEESVKRIGIDGSADAIKEAIKSAFRLRTKRSFWLEDEAGIIRALDRNMPLRNYTLHLDDGLRIRICLFEDPNHLHCRVIEKAFFNEDVFNSYLNNCGWIGLKELRSRKNVDSMNELRAGEVYHGQRRVLKN